MGNPKASFSVNLNGMFIIDVYYRGDMCLHLYYMACALLLSLLAVMKILLGRYSLPPIHLLKLLQWNDTVYPVFICHLRYCKEVNVKEINMLKCLEIENEIARLVITLNGYLPCKPGYLSSIHRTHSRGRLPKVVLWPLHKLASALSHTHSRDWGKSDTNNYVIDLGRGILF